ncbi:hypothetical protein ACNR9Q_02425 [Maribacter sp. X9]|uniref:hypothetical protein n=1 Tax=Maribacter sp. X9 TaxID=3402159 RepID=UPI003AF3F879
MNSKIIIFLALFLSAAIFAPSIKSLLDLDSKTGLAIDLNEEESQEIQNDIDQQEFLEVEKHYQFYSQAEKAMLTNFSVSNIGSSTSLDILLPPPRMNA